MKIAIVGELRSGKDTFASYFIERGYRQFAFGDGIKEVINMYFPHLWAEGKPRKAMQIIGQSFRAIDPMYWINKLDKKVYWYERIFGYKQDVDVIVTDLRQPNEYDYLKEKGYTVIKVYADLETRIRRAEEAGDKFDMESLNHETEKFIRDIPCDIFVENNGTIEELLYNAENIYNKLGGTK
ncbi:AAA family ATPase [Bacillus thuringiensis]|uniref:deoxynucleotide monophosphate kinase family protein n=1 Tax=Bacillus thuringiensis TaxID=1428 RepID=UPI00345A0E39